MPDSAGLLERKKILEETKYYLLHVVGVDANASMRNRHPNLGKKPHPH